MRELFVVSMLILGFFLVAHKLSTRGLDNTLSFTAGVAAIGVAIFPPSVVEAGDSLTPVQEYIGEATALGIHTFFGAAFFLALTAIVFFFGMREKSRSCLRKWIHYTAAAVMVGAFVVAIPFTALNISADDADGNYVVLVAESVALFAFGVSWLVKELDWKMLLWSRSSG